MRGTLFIFLAALAFSASLHAEPQSTISSLTLEDARLLLLEKNYELQAARRMVEGLQADTLTAGQKPNPTLSVNSTSWRLGQSNGSGLWDRKVDTVVRFDQLIERGNKRALRSEAAQQAVQAGQYDLGEMQRQQAVALAGTYYDLALAQEKERIYRDTVDLYDKTLQAAEFRLRAGDIAATDVSRIRVDALRVRNDLRLATAEREKSQTALAYLIGQENSAGSLQAVDAFPRAAVPDIALDERMLRQRPDMQAAQARIHQAEKQRDLAHSLQTRDITVGVQYEHFPTDANNSIGAGVSIPLFTNYQYQGEIARAEVNLTAAIEDMERVRAQAVAEIGRARADLLAAAERAQRFDDAMVQEAQKAAEGADFAYQHGALGVMDLLDSRRTLRALQLESATTHADFAKAEAAWHAATNTETR